MAARLVFVPGAALASLLLALSALIAASPKMEPMGVVTWLDGTATLTRAALPAGTLLKFRDPVYRADRIATGDASLARVLLGGRALVTVRERSVLTITEQPNVSTVDIGSGRIAIAVMRDRMKPGEVIEIRTPNAVAAIRGTVVVTEVSQATSDAGATAFTTTITVLKGLVEVQRFDRLTRHATGAVYSVGALQSLRVTGSAPAGAVERITRERAHRLMQEFRRDPSPQAPATNASVIGIYMRQVP
jgi:hypothetical protein